MSVMSSWPIVLFELTISVLILCPLALSITEKRILKYPTTMAELAIPLAVLFVVP